MIEMQSAAVGVVSSAALVCIPFWWDVLAKLCDKISGWKNQSWTFARVGIVIKKKIAIFQQRCVCFQISALKKKVKKAKIAAPSAIFKGKQ